MPLPTVAIPYYDLTLPVSKQTISFRPFVVGEEKLLLMAVESNDSGSIYKTIKQIIENCTDKKVDIEKLASSDLEYLFLQLRIKSLGEIVEPQIKCPECKEGFTIKVNLTEISLTNGSKSNKIPLTNEVGVIMKYPTLESSKAFAEKIGDSEVKVTDLIELISGCIETVYDQAQVYKATDFTKEEMIEFLEKLPDSCFEPIIRFLDSLPKLVYQKSLTCPKCQKPIELKLEGLQDFFT